MAGALAATDAWWVPGERHAYHTNTYGHLVGEIVRRVSGETCGARLRAMTAPLEADIWFGVPPSEHRRCADVVWGAKQRAEGAGFSHLQGDELMAMLSYFDPAAYSSIGVVNTARWRSARRCRPPTVTAPRAGSPACTPHYLSLGECSRPTFWQRRPRLSPRATAPSWARRSPSVLASSRPFPVDVSGPTRAASGTSAPAVRWASPTPKRASRSARDEHVIPRRQSADRALMDRCTARCDPLLVRGARTASVARSPPTRRQATRW